MPSTAPPSQPPMDVAPTVVPLSPMSSTEALLADPFRGSCSPHLQMSGAFDSVPDLHAAARGDDARNRRKRNRLSLPLVSPSVPNLARSGSRKRDSRDSRELRNSPHALATRLVAFSASFSTSSLVNGSNTSHTSTSQPTESPTIPYESPLPEPMRASPYAHLRVQRAVARAAMASQLSLHAEEAEDAQTNKNRKQEPAVVRAQRSVWGEKQPKVVRWIHNSICRPFGEKYTLKSC